MGAEGGSSTEIRYRGNADMNRNSIYSKQSTSLNETDEERSSQDNNNLTTVTTNTNFYAKLKEQYASSRRLSHPVTSFRNLGVPNPMVPNQHSAKRRLSQVSEEVARRLSTNIRWRTFDAREIGNEAKSLCSQYIRARFRRSGLLDRKMSLVRLRSVMNMTLSYGSCEVFSELNLLGKELEHTYPKLYRSVCRQICITLTSQEVLRKVFQNLARGLFQDGDVTWGRIVALFAIVGGLAVDSVHQGHADYITCLIECLGRFVEEELATFIGEQGGWITLLTRFKPNSKSSNLHITMVLLFFVIVLWCAYLHTAGYRMPRIF